MMLSAGYENVHRASPGPPPVTSKLPDHSPHALCGGIPEHSQYQVTHMHYIKQLCGGIKALILAA